MIKTSTLLLTLLFSTSSIEAAAPKGLASFFEKASSQPQQEKALTMSKEEILKTLETETKKEKMDLLLVSQQLYAAGEHLDKNFDEAFLKSVLSYYPAILKKEMSHTLVEMFAESYKKNQKRFDTVLEQSLNEEQRQDFKDRIQAAFYEQENGQG